MTGSHDNAVERWFGDRFASLHPLLQQLHRQGGSLRGTVAIRTGTGVAAWAGRRIAKKIGVPIDTPQSAFEVQISHANEVLHWNRRFGGEHLMRSTFRPVGTWPEGYWIENTGPVTLHLTVDVIDGAWHWRCLRAYVAGIRLPLRLFPKSTAYKRIQDGRYQFHVGFSLPLLGPLVSYEGSLEPAPHAF